MEATGSLGHVCSLVLVQAVAMLTAIISRNISLGKRVMMVIVMIVRLIITVSSK